MLVDNFSHISQDDLAPDPIPQERSHLMERLLFLECKEVCIRRSSQGMQLGEDFTKEIGCMDPTCRSLGDQGIECDGIVQELFDKDVPVRDGEMRHELGDANRFEV